MSVTAYVVEAAGQPAVAKQVDLPALGDNDVEVKVEYCGICASDVDALDGKYGPMMKFPAVAGHEGVGTVTATGKNVTHVAVGAKVGLGVYRASCGHCTTCCAGRDNLCGQKELMFMGGKSGPFGSVVRIDERYATPLPDGLHLPTAGPLLCAGATVFGPFVEHRIQSTHRVGVVGIGGLGHLALLFAKAMGCATTAISRSAAKREECKSTFKVDRFVDSSDAESVKAGMGSLDFILVTAGGTSVDYAMLLSLLAANGTILLMGATGMEVGPLPMMPLVMGQKGIRGCAAASRLGVREMLAFAARHDIRPMCEEFPVEQINEAFERLRQGKLRYRAVLKW